MSFANHAIAARNQVLESRHDVQNAAKAGDVSVLRDAQV